MLEEAESLKSMGVKILAVMYGNNITGNKYGMKNLMKMATRSKDVFAIDFQNNDLLLQEKIESIATHLIQVDCPRQYSRKFSQSTF